MAYLAKVDSGCMAEGATRHFRRSPIVMSQANIRIEGQLGRDMVLRETIEKLKTDLIKKAKRYFITIAS